MAITKTDYLEYTYCKKNLWLMKHKPELFKDKELSEFEKKIIEEGNLADEAARNLFPDGTLIKLKGINAVQVTKDCLDSKAKTLFQAAFVSDGFFVQADVLRYNDVLGGWELYEVKATNDVKREIPHHHINDLAFQKTVIEGSGLRIAKMGVIHLNCEYRKSGKVRYEDLFTIAVVTDEVQIAIDGVRDQMGDLKIYLEMSEEKGCECIYRGRNAQCTTFAYSNPEVPEYSVHDISRIGASKSLFYDWIDRGIFRIEDIDNPEALQGAKQAQYEAYMTQRPLIDQEAIRSALNALKFPIQFFDYETYTCAIPKFDGFGAYEQVPFQYSLHVLHEDGTLEHKEFLAKASKEPIALPLIEQMRRDFDGQGSVIAWYASFEQQRNNKLAELYPEHANFLEALNDRMFDLMSIFSSNFYVDAAFKGSCSIKNVLPVLVPELSYKVLKIQKGDQAVERWERLIDQRTPPEAAEQIVCDLLEYCKLDTLAMVEIYRFLLKTF